MWLCDMSWALAFMANANVKSANTDNLVRILRTGMVRRNSAFIVGLLCCENFDSVGKAFNITIPDNIASVEIGDRQKAMPLTFGQRHRLRFSRSRARALGN